MRRAQLGTPKRPPIVDDLRSDALRDINTRRLSAVISSASFQKLLLASLAVEYRVFNVAAFAGLLILASRNIGCLDQYESSCMRPHLFVR